MKVNDKVLYDGTAIKGRGLAIKAKAIITIIEPDGIEIKLQDGYRIWLSNKVIKYRIKELNNE